MTIQICDNPRVTTQKAMQNIWFFKRFLLTWDKNIKLNITAHNVITYKLNPALFVGKKNILILFFTINKFNAQIHKLTQTYIKWHTICDRLHHASKHHVISKYLAISFSLSLSLKLTKNVRNKKWHKVGPDMKQHALTYFSIFAFRFARITNSSNQVAGRNIFYMIS